MSLDVYLSYEDDFDLVNIPEEREVWVNIYHSHGKSFVTGDEVYVRNTTLYGVHSSKEEADKNAGTKRIARIRVRYKEGQFDE